MSLDVYLIDESLDQEDQEVYWANITHNLATMADHAGLYYALWRPEEIPATQSKHIVNIVESGLKALKDKPEYFKQFNADNGWGLYKDFVPWVERYLEALKEYPEAIIETSK